MPGDPEIPVAGFDDTETAETSFDCLLVTRPQPEAAELANRLAIPGLNVILQPAYEFSRVDISPADQAALRSAAQDEIPPLLVFTSTRAVHFALAQLPVELLGACRLAAIGAASAAALQQAGLRDVIQPQTGYRSEDLLQTLDALSMPLTRAWIVAAAGGRKALLEGLQRRGINACMLLAYQRQAVAVDPANQQQLELGRRVLSVWTSASAMQYLSGSLSAAAWQQVCAGEWLVISQRLADAAEQFQPAVVHQSAGPGNAELAAAIEEICHSG